MVWLLFNQSSKAFVKNADPVHVRYTLWKFYWFIALVICCLKSGVLKNVNNRLTHQPRFGKHATRHVIRTREMSHSRSLRSIHFIWFLTTWITVDLIIQANVSLCWFPCYCTVGWVKNSHYSSDCLINCIVHVRLISYNVKCHWWTYTISFCLVLSCPVLSCFCFVFVLFCLFIVCFLLGGGV